jgi:hypothetical protein
MMVSLLEMNLTAALSLADANFRVFPARAIYKRETGRWNKPPCLSNWQSLATNDLDQIRWWWSQHPDAIPAVCCEHFVVIDADRHPGGADGIAALRALAAKHGDWANHPSVLTPGNGEHHYFRQANPPLGNGTGQLPPGIDVRSAGGYVIGVGAVLPDGTGWTLAPGHSTDLPIVPPWLEEIIRTSKIPEITRAGNASTCSVTRREERYAKAALEGGIREIESAPKGRRNATLNNVAYRLGRMAARGWIDRHQVENGLENAAVRLRNEDGLLAVRATIRSGLEAGIRKPHPDLVDPKGCGK